MKIGIIEDNPMYAELLRHHLTQHERFEIDIYHDAESFMKDRKDHDLVISDYHLNNADDKDHLNGSDVIQWLKNKDSKALVIALSAQKEVKTAIELMKLGIYDYLLKDDNTLSQLSADVLAIENKLSLDISKKQYFSNLKKDKNQLTLWLFGLATTVAVAFGVFWLGG